MTPNYSLNYARSGSANSTASTSPLDDRSHRSAPAPFSPNEALIFMRFRELMSARGNALLQLFLPVLNDRNRRHSCPYQKFRRCHRMRPATRGASKLTGRSESDGNHPHSASSDLPGRSCGILLIRPGVDADVWASVS